MVDSELTFINVVRPGKLLLVRLATLPVLISSFVTPPTKGLKTSPDSPKKPWQLAHLLSQTSCPLATEPDPAGNPLKSGRTSMSHAATSLLVASRPTPGYFTLLCATLHPAKAKSKAASAYLRYLDIFHLTAFLDEPGLNCIVVIDRSCPSNRPQLLISGLNKACFIGGPTLNNGRFAIPDPIKVEA